MTPDRIQVIRYTDTPGMDAGTNRTVIVDDLPLSAINNGGDLVFGIETPSPHLYVSLGDTENQLLAQTDGARRRTRPALRRRRVDPRGQPRPGRSRSGSAACATPSASTSSLRRATSSAPTTAPTPATS